MSASIEKSTNGLKVSWASCTRARSILVEFKDVDEELEWILLPRSTSSSVIRRGVPEPAFTASEVEIRGIPEHALSAHEFQTTVYCCDSQTSLGTVSSYLVTESYQATCSTSAQDDHLERQFRRQLRLTSSSTVSRSIHGEYAKLYYRMSNLTVNLVMQT